MAGGTGRARHTCPGPTHPLRPPSRTPPSATPVMRSHPFRSGTPVTARSHTPPGPAHLFRRGPTPGASVPHPVDDLWSAPTGVRLRAARQIRDRPCSRRAASGTTGGRKAWRWLTLSHTRSQPAPVVDGVCRDPRRCAAVSKQLWEDRAGVRRGPVTRTPMPSRPRPPAPAGRGDPAHPARVTPGPGRSASARSDRRTQLASLPDPADRLPPGAAVPPTSLHPKRQPGRPAPVDAAAGTSAGSRTGARPTPRHEPGGPVVPRTTRRGRRRIRRGPAPSSPSARSSTHPTASRAISAVSCATVVRSMWASRESWLSS
jgi:hypothetical protein